MAHQLATIALGFLLFWTTSAASLENEELTRQEDVDNWSLRELNAAFKSHQADNERRIQQLEEELNLLKETASSQRVVPGNLQTFESPVAFFVVLTESFSGGGDMATVPYDYVYLNHGDAYSTSDYHFTAPVRGLYSFSVSAFSRDNYYGLVGLFLNGQKLVVSYSGPTGWNQGAVTTMLMMEAGDRVNCVKGLDSYWLWEDANGPFNAFSGFLYTQF